MRRLLAAALAASALATASPAAAQPFTDVTPADTGIVLCPADLGGGGAALAWQRFGETSAGRDTLDLAAAGLDPVTPPKTLVVFGGCPKVATAATGASLIALNYTGLAEGEGQVIVLDRARERHDEHAARAQRRRARAGRRGRGRIERRGARRLGGVKSGGHRPGHGHPGRRARRRRRVRAGRHAGHGEPRRGGRHRRGGLRHRRLVGDRPERRQRQPAARRDPRARRRVLGAARGRPRGGRPRGGQPPGTRTATG